MELNVFGFKQNDGKRVYTPREDLDTIGVSLAETLKQENIPMIETNYDEFKLKIGTYQELDKEVQSLEIALSKKKGELKILKNQIYSIFRINVIAFHAMAAVIPRLKSIAAKFQLKKPKKSKTPVATTNPTGATST